jgi:hypothetical protein
MLDYYENIFASVGPEPIPRELLVDGLLDATRFDWRTCSDDDYIEEEPGYMTAGEIARLAAIARETTTIGDGGEPRRLFTLRRGTVWVGTRGGA